MSWSDLPADKLAWLTSNTRLEHHQDGTPVNDLQVPEQQDFMVVQLIYMVDTHRSQNPTTGADDTLNIHLFQDNRYTTSTNTSYRDMLLRWKQQPNRPVFSSVPANMSGSTTTRNVNTEHLATSTVSAQSAMVETSLLAEKVMTDALDTGSIHADHLEITDTLRLGNTTLNNTGLEGIDTIMSTIKIKDKLDFEAVFFQANKRSDAGA